MEILVEQLALSEVIQQSSVTVSNTPAEEWTEGTVSSRGELLDMYWADFQANHVRILQTAGIRNDPYFTDNIYFETERNYVSTRGRLYDAGYRFRPEPTNRVTNHSNNGSTRLPRVKVPSFSGRREDWESFRDLFRSIIHDDVSLSAVGKMYHLKTLVEGEAKLALEKLQITGPNYDIAWTLLETRYDIPRILAQDHLMSLKRLPTIEEENAGEIQRLLDELERHRNQLRILERPVDQWDDWFISLATDAMDPTTRRDWEEELERLHHAAGEVRNWHPQFVALQSFLERRCRSLKSLEAERPRNLERSSLRTSSRSTPTSNKFRMAAATITSSVSCGVCGGSHYAGHCDYYKGLNPQERRSLVLRRQLCYNCLRENHTAQNCPSPTSCRTCGGRHHTLIHEGAGKRSGTAPTSGIPAKVARQQTTAPGASLAAESTVS